MADEERTVTFPWDPANSVRVRVVPARPGWDNELAPPHVYVRTVDPPLGCYRGVWPVCRAWLS